jgi:activator of HSP90 ATPase
MLPLTLESYGAESKGIQDWVSWKHAKATNQSSENIVQTYLDNIAIAVLSKPEDVLGVDGQERVSLFSGRVPNKNVLEWVLASLACGRGGVGHLT